MPTAPSSTATVTPPSPTTTAAPSQFPPQAPRPAPISSPPSPTPHLVKVSMKRAWGGAVSVDQWPPQEEGWETRQCWEPSLWGIKYARRKVGSDAKFAYYCGQHRRRWQSCVECNTALRPVPSPDTPATFTTTSHNDMASVRAAAAVLHGMHATTTAMRAREGGGVGGIGFAPPPPGGIREELYLVTTYKDGTIFMAPAQPSMPLGAG